MTDVATVPTNSNNNRKRARDAASPRPPRRVPAAVSSVADPASLQLELQRADQLGDPLRRNTILNELLVQTSAHDRSNALLSDAVLVALANVVTDDCLELDDNDFMLMEDARKDKPVFDPSTIWTKTPTKRTDALAKAYKNKLSIYAPASVYRTSNQPDSSSPPIDKLKTLQVILMIFRNYSFVAANVRLLTYSPDLLDMLVGCLYDGSSSSSSSDNITTIDSAAQSALQTLLHLAPSMDWTGQRLLADKLFYAPTAESYPIPNDNDDDDTDFGQLADARHWGWMGLQLAKRFDARDDVLAVASAASTSVSGGANADGISNASGSNTLSRQDFVMAVTGPNYLASIWSLFAGVGHVFTKIPAPPRQTMLLAMDLLQEFVNQARIGLVGDVSLEHDPNDIPSLRAVLVQMPDAMLDRLLECLYIPKHGPESWDGQSAVAASGGRATAWKPQQGYDNIVDTDLRDRALEILVPLMELDSPRMAAKIGRRRLYGQPRLDVFHAVVPILTTTSGKNEVSLLASQFLRELSKAPENRIGLEFIQERLVELASRDDRVAHLVWNHIYAKPTTEGAGSEPSVVEQE